MKLVVVESPTKAKTLASILGKDYEIEASMGHIRDLPKSGLGIELENNFTPVYQVPDKAKKVLAQIKKHLAASSGVILATDPDREGEAIAWHLKELLAGTKEGKKLEYKRVVFHELTKEAVLEAFTHTSDININLVDSQQARRVLDRLVGYKLSPLLWKKVRYGLSAGRVQSVAVRLVVERERERDAFAPKEYWSIHCSFQTEAGAGFEATLDKLGTSKAELASEAQADAVKQSLIASTFKLTDIKVAQRLSNPLPPFKTSTLQQYMSNVYGMSASKTMSAAQKLFEGGYITYHRTDSLTLAVKFIKQVREYVSTTYGVNYIPEKAIGYKTKSKNAQEAHEAIRPTSVTLTPFGIVAKKITEDERRVYLAIWKRALECQMRSAVYNVTSAEITSSSAHVLKASGSTIAFDGWLKVGNVLNINDQSNDDEPKLLPNLATGAAVVLLQVMPKQHFTQPAPRYNDASLIKKLEELEIGRPSTYAPIIATIQKRGYVTRDGRAFVPSDFAYVVTDLLDKNFPEITDYEFTAKVENELDSIAAGEQKWVPVIEKFYTPFAKLVDEKEKTLSKHDIIMLGETDEVCPDCGAPLQIKLGKYGRFLSCSNYPTCPFASPLNDKQSPSSLLEADNVFEKCPNCDTGTLKLKQGRFGKFYACTNYPKCKTTKPYVEKLGMICPKCSTGDVIIKKAKGRIFYGCSAYPECTYSSWKNPLISTAATTPDNELTLQ